MPEEVLKALLTASPLAAVLALAVKVLWDKLQTSEDARSSERKELIAREDTIRSDLEGRIEKLRLEQNEAYRELNQILKGLISGEGED